MPCCSNWEDLGGSLGSFTPICRLGKLQTSKVIFQLLRDRTLFPVATFIQDQLEGVLCVCLFVFNKGLKHHNYVQVEKNCPWVQELAHTSAQAYTYDSFAHHLTLFLTNQTHQTSLVQCVFCVYLCFHLDGESLN